MIVFLLTIITYFLQKLSLYILGNILAILDAKQDYQVNKIVDDNTFLQN